MAANFSKISFLFFILCIWSIYATGILDKTCTVCKRRCDKTMVSTRCISTQIDILFTCFGIVRDGEGSALVCTTCRRAISEHKDTGKTFFHLVNSQEKKVGRPKKRKINEHQRKSNEEADLEPVSEWRTDETCFGTIKRDLNGDVLLPAEVFEEIDKQFAKIPERCDLKDELERVKGKIYQEFVVAKKPAIYEPNEFNSFCKSAGALTIFDHILVAMTSGRHSDTRVNLNKKRTVLIIYNMCYSLSQLCNILQVDHALFLRSQNINQEGFETEYELGNSCCRKTVNNIVKTLSTGHSQNLENFFSAAIMNEWLIILIIDDFTSIHTDRRPNYDKTSTCKNMCTIIVKAFKTLKALKRPQNINQVHDPAGVNINSCCETIASPNSMSLLADTYCSVMPLWLVSAFHDPESERHRLDEHQYCDDQSVRDMRKMNDLHLLNFIELELKSKESFSTAYDVALSTGLRQYLKRFVVVQPGDWPCQFYCRQEVYDGIPLHEQNNNVPVNPITTKNNQDHSYSFGNEFKDRYQLQNHQYNLSTPISPVTSLVPTMGPLHISLNSREHVFINFRPFFQNVYKHLFPHSKLAEKPKPWRINMILETVYGAWTLIREKAMSIFIHSKDLQFGTLLNLLDNYIPLVLSIYTITFKMNNFAEYQRAMVRIWVMFVCLKRRHYNKAPLVWFSNLAHWGLNFGELYNLFRQWPTIFDEYPVENTHSILREQTRSTDTAEQLTNKAKAIFESKDKQANFRSTFSPPKQFTFSQNQMQFLKVKCAKYLTSVIKNIYSKPGSASLKTSHKNKGKIAQHVVLPDICGDNPVRNVILPLGYHSKNIPDENCKCDLDSCKIEDNNEPWKLFQGCWHSFHLKCVKNSTFCPICKSHIENKVKELGKIAQNAILHPKMNDQDKEEAEDSEQPNQVDGEDNSDNMVHIPKNNIDQSNVINTLNHELGSLQSLNQPSSSHKPHPPPPRPPHCKTCLHPMQGHMRQQGQGVQCVQCPNKMCSVNINKICTCAWHTPQMQNNQLQTSELAPQHTTQAPVQQSNTPSTFLAVTKNTLPGNITEWFLPKNICQSNIHGVPIQSNACTLISVLVSFNFLSGNIPLPITMDEVVQNISKFGQIMRAGNILYHTLGITHHQPNLEVRDVLDRVPNINLQISEDLGFFCVKDIIEKLDMLHQKNDRNAGILIVPPDKSMAILMDNGKVGLFDSHEHGLHGGIITTSTSENIKDFVAYLQLMVMRDWQASLEGCNFTLVKLQA